MNHTEINKMIEKLPEPEKELVTDWYHTFKELYAHRIKLFMALCSTIADLEYAELYLPNAHRIDFTKYPRCWKSKLHADWTMFDWWFIAWIGKEKWETLTYHLPMSEWEHLSAVEIEKAPEWDWHTSDDVLNLLSRF